MDQSVKFLAKNLLKICQEKEWQISCAESCTGGMICSTLTSIPGASRIFSRGFITYSNQAKVEMLGVLPATIEKYGAVSEETALEMVIGTQKNAKSEIAIAVTGIAGPDGGSDQKPVGTVFIALAILNKTWVIQKNFTELEISELDQYQPDYSSIRSIIRNLTVNSALEILLQKLGQISI